MYLFLWVEANVYTAEAFSRDHPQFFFCLLGAKMFACAPGLGAPPFSPLSVGTSSSLSDRREEQVRRCWVIRLPWNVLSCCSHSLPCRLLLGEVVLLKDVFPLESLESAPTVGRHPQNGCVLALFLGKQPRLRSSATLKRGRSSSPWTIYMSCPQ